MEKFIAESKGILRIFNTEKKAKDFVAENPDAKYLRRREWTCRNKTISGDNLINAVENEFDSINHELGIHGASGYHLEKVFLRRIGDNTVEMVIKAYPFSTGVVGFGKGQRYKFSPENLQTKTIQIEDVDPDEFGDFYEYELRE